VVGWRPGLAAAIRANRFGSNKNSIEEIGNFTVEPCAVQRACGGGWFNHLTIKTTQLDSIDILYYTKYLLFPKTLAVSKYFKSFMFNERRGERKAIKDFNQTQNEIIEL